MAKARASSKAAAPQAAKPKSGAPEQSAYAKWKHGHFYWNELMTRDAERAKAFYTATLGWTFEGMQMSEGMYWVAMAGTESQPIGGIFEMKGPEFTDVPEHWMAYIAVDDVDKRIAKALSNGAKLHRPAFDVQGVGRIAIIQEPGGAAIGWMTPKPGPM